MQTVLREHIAVTLLCAQLYTYLAIHCHPERSEEPLYFSVVPQVRARFLGANLGAACTVETLVYVVFDCYTFFLPHGPKRSTEE